MENQIFISKLHIEKVRHLSSIDIPLSENERKHLIITGKNGSGKTSLILSIKQLLLGLLNQIQKNVNKSKEFLLPVFDLGKPFELLNMTNNDVTESVSLWVNDENLLREKIFKGEFLFKEFESSRSVKSFRKPEKV